MPRAGGYPGGGRHGRRTAGRPRRRRAHRGVKRTKAPNRLRASPARSYARAAHRGAVATARRDVTHGSRGEPSSGAQSGAEHREAQSPGGGGRPHAHAGHRVARRRRAPAAARPSPAAGRSRPPPAGAWSARSSSRSRRSASTRTPHASALTEGYGAEALTVGKHIAFRAGRFRPGSEAGDRVLAHELAHVVQQRGREPTRRPRRGARCPSPTSLRSWRPRRPRRASCAASARG